MPRTYLGFAHDIPPGYTSRTYVQCYPGHIPGHTSRPYLEDIYLQDIYPGHHPPVSWATGGVCPGPSGYVLEVSRNFYMSWSTPCPRHTSWGYVLGVCPGEHCSPGHTSRTYPYVLGNMINFSMFPRTPPPCSPGHTYVLEICPGHIKLYRCIINTCLCFITVVLL